MTDFLSTEARRHPVLIEDLKVIYVLTGIVFFNAAFPITNLGNFAEIAFYFAYSFVLGTGIYLIGDQRIPIILGVFFAIGSFAMGIVNAFVFIPVTADLWAAFLILMQAILIHALIRYIFTSHRVSRDVLLAGIAIYMLMGSIFIPAYTGIENNIPGSFVMNAAIEGPMQWQHFLYFSYVTLTTAGYGDITPVKPIAQSVAVTQSIIGVLYLAILMARLVSLYAADLAQERLGETQ